MSESAENRELLAAEYVLGTLEGPDRQEVAARAGHEPALAASIAWWENWLAPLASLVAPVAPPAALWERIAASMAARPAGAARETGIPPRTGILRSLAFWRVGTAAGFALAAAFAAIAFLRPPAAGPVAALVPPNGTPAVFVAELQRDGRIRLIQLEPVHVAPDHALQLWELPAGATQPVSLGVIPASVSTVAPSARAAGGTQLMVTLEPAGGTTGGAPSGPVLWNGTLRGRVQD
jgi:anti-sigma-K factor RskA